MYYFSLLYHQHNVQYGYFFMTTKLFFLYLFSLDMFHGKAYVELREEPFECQHEQEVSFFVSTI